MSEQQPISNGTYVICDVERQRFTGCVMSHLFRDGNYVYQVQAELPQGTPLVPVYASQIVDIF